MTKKYQNWGKLTTNFSGSTANFNQLAFPMAKRVFSKLVAHDIVSVQPMAHSSQLMYLDLVYKGMSDLEKRLQKISFKNNGYVPRENCMTTVVALHELKKYLKSEGYSGTIETNQRFTQVTLTMTLGLFEFKLNNNSSDKHTTFEILLNGSWRKLNYVQFVIEEHFSWEDIKESIEFILFGAAIKL